MDFSKPLGVEYRFVKNAVHSGQPARIVSGSRSFDTSADDLWEALTSPDRLPRWFLPVSGDLQLGGRYQLEGNAGGEITRCDPPKALEVTWECSGNVSWVHLTLESEDHGVRLTLEHIMLKDEESEAHWKKFGPGATGVGWDLSFIGLGMHLESGETIRQEESYAWMGSDEGKEFIRQCALAWGDAHIESGEEADVAGKMAEQTAKFYCGESD